MTFEEKYKKYAKDNLQNAIDWAKRDFVEDIKKNNTEESRLVKEIVGIKQDYEGDQDEYIQNEWKKIESDVVKETKKLQFNIKKYNGHKTKYKGFDIDISKVCKDMRTLKCEVGRFLLFNKKLDLDKNGKARYKHKYIGHIDYTSNNEMNIYADAIIGAIKKIINDYPECNEVIAIHNHPYVANAIPSFCDGVSCVEKKQVFGTFSIDLYDDCVISALDFYSRRQDEKTRNKDRIILPQKFSKGLQELMAKENKYYCFRFVSKEIVIDSYDTIFM